MARMLTANGVTIIEVAPAPSGNREADIAELRDVLLKAADTATPPLLLVDLSSAFISSRMLEALIRAWRRVSDRNGRMALCNVSPVCAEVLKESTLDLIWDVYSTREEAQQVLSAAL